MSLHAECPRCGTDKLYRVPKRNKKDPTEYDAYCDTCKKWSFWPKVVTSCNQKGESE
jgi:hypothetical protein